MLGSDDLVVVEAEDALRRDWPPSSGNNTLGNRHTALQISVQHLKILTSILRSTYPVRFLKWVTIVQPATQISNDVSPMGLRSYASWVLIGKEITECSDMPTYICNLTRASVTSRSDIQNGSR